MVFCWILGRWYFIEASDDGIFLEPRPMAFHWSQPQMIVIRTSCGRRHFIGAAADNIS